MQTGRSSSVANTPVPMVAPLRHMMATAGDHDTRCPRHAPLHHLHAFAPEVTHSFLYDFLEREAGESEASQHDHAKAESQREQEPEEKR